jgi:SOS-response transcriptional repressor LexA
MKKVDRTDQERQEAAKLKALYNSRKRGLQISHESIAESLDVTQSAISHYLNGVNPLNLRVAVAFSKILGVPISSFSPRLQSEMDAMDTDHATSGVRSPQASYNAALVETKLVPLIAWVQAGDWCDSPDNNQFGDAEEWMAAPYRHGKRAFCLKVIGDSMSPDYRENEIILVDPDVEARHNDDVVIRNGDGNHTFKRLQITPEGTYLLALNPDHPDRKIKIPHGSSVCGVVIGSWMRRR